MNSQRIAKNQGGIVMLEGLIAIVIFAFGVLALVAMQAASVRNTTDAKYRVDAAFLINQALGEMWADRGNLAAHEVDKEAVAALPNGKRTIEVDGDEVTITVTWQLPGDSKIHTHSSITRING